MLPPPSPISQKTKKSYNNNNNKKTSKTKQIDKNKSKQNNKNEQINKTNKQRKKQTKKPKKTSHQLWCQNLWLWTVALHMCYRRLTLSLTTVDSWLTGVICEVVNPQRPDQDWQAPLQCFSWKLGSCRGVNSWRLSEQTQSHYLDWGNMWGHHTQRQC